MAKKKGELTRNSVTAPAGFQKVSGGKSWKFKEQNVLQGKLLSFSRHISTKYFDTIRHEDGTEEQRGKPQRRATIVDEDGVIWHVWESPGLKELFNQVPGVTVWLGYVGEKETGRGEPMNEFEIAVAG